jgi:hypothetical protein
VARRGDFIFGDKNVRRSVSGDHRQTQGEGLQGITQSPNLGEFNAYDYEDVNINMPDFLCRPENACRNSAPFVFI